MSDIVLSSATRQSLLSAQDTAALLATTQNRLATGKKVNSALDNPTSFFTASGLDSRANDISSLLDTISNGVQAIQAANTGITSIQKLVDTAKSVANQALQTTVGFSAKSSITTAAVAGATSSDLLGAGPATNAIKSGTAVTNANTTSAYSNNTVSGTAVQNNNSSSVAITAATKLTEASSGSSDGLAAAPTGVLTVNGKTITFDATTTTASVTDGSGNVRIGTNTGSLATIQTILSAIDSITGATGPTASIVDTGGNAGKLKISTGVASSLTVTGTGTALSALGLTSAVASPVARSGGVTGTSGTLAGTTKLSGAAPGGGSSLSSAFADGDTLTVNNQVLTFKSSGASGNNQINITDDLTALLGKIDTLSGNTGAGSVASTVDNTGTVKLGTGAAADLSIVSSNTSALNALGLGNTGTVTQARTTGTSALSGLILNIGATGGGVASSITFGSSAGQVSTLAQLNTALAGNNLQAAISTTGAITISTTNDAASSTIGAISGTAAGAGKAFNGLAGAAPTADSNAASTRANLVTQYNNILDQIGKTAQDTGYNGINLLGGDTLKLTFNETGKSKLSIQGVTFDAAGLGLSTITSADFQDNISTNKVLNTLNTSATSLRSQASSFGSNLSIVQARQNFNKNIINVLQTGSANLTNADLNEEAANSQALSTRQSLTISALSLANTAQQNVLQLLR